MFAAVVPPATAVDDLEEFLAARRDERWRWTVAPQWHLTLAFMPTVDRARLDDLVVRMRRAAGRCTPMAMSIAGGGAFPRPARATVLYAGVELDDGTRQRLQQLARRIRAAAEKAGAPAEGGPFRPHLTIARSRRPQPATTWLQTLSEYAGQRFVVGEIALIESHLGAGPGGRPRYDMTHTFPLAGAA